MAPFSPLPIGYSPRSPKALPHPRPFAHIFGQTLHIPSRQRTQDPPIICGPESKGWMACLALSCFLVVVWLAALPEGSGRSMAALERDQLMATRGLHDLGDGMGAGLLWVYDEPKPIVGYGLGVSKRQEPATNDLMKQVPEKKQPDKEDSEGPASTQGDRPVPIKGDNDTYGGGNGKDEEKDDRKADGRDEVNEEPERREYRKAQDDQATSEAAPLAVQPSGNQAQISAPAQQSASSSPAVLVRDGPHGAAAPSPTPIMSASSAFLKIRRAASSSTPSSSTFSSPPFADQPSAQETDGPDNGTVNDGASSPAPAPTSASPAGPQKRARRRSRFRRGGGW